MTADILIDREAYRVCRLLPAYEFVSFCKARGISIEHDRLRRFEKLGLFYPMMRVYRPDEIRKVEYIDGGKRYHDLGPLKEGEEWGGETRIELPQFSFGARYIRSWREHGLVWDPRTEESPHATSIDTEQRRHIAYYSQFQIRSLSFLISSLTLHVHMEGVIEDDGKTPSNFNDNRDWMLKHVQHLIEAEKPTGAREDTALLCQIISDRYYPKTQTDERRFTLTSGGTDFHGWDWYAYARAWDARAFLEQFEISQDELKRQYEVVSGSLRFVDPLDAWQSLVRFISVEKRAKLKNEALQGQTLREMALMLRLLYLDAYGEALPQPHDVNKEIFHKIPDIDPETDPLRALEFITNDFHINPKPKLVLFVEGETEAAIIPRLFDEIFGASPSIYGIEIVNLKGINNITGGKKESLSALWRLIDYLHHHQTIAVILADNEGWASKNLRHGLPQALSTYFPDRKTTRPNYVRIWSLCFELNNFSDTEIALALTELGAPTSRAEIAACRASARLAAKNKKAITIASIYENKMGRGLNKIILANKLVDIMLRPDTKRAAKNRPISLFLHKIAELSARNHQPITHAMWEYNQRTGFVGTLRPGAVGKRKNLFGQSRKRRRK